MLVKPWYSFPSGGERVRTLVGIDLRASSGHDRLVSRAAAYALRLGAVVDVVFFLDGASEQPDQRPRLDRMLAALPQALRGISLIDERAAAAGLVEMSGEYQLMVLGSCEPSAWVRLLKGAAAARVLRKALCPVLVPRGEGLPNHAPRMLVGVDVEGLDPGNILRHCAWWAEQLGGRLDALYVEENQLPHIAERAVREAAEREWSALRAPKFERLKDLLRESVVEENRGEPLLRQGDADAVLSKLSTEYDVVFVGNRDRDGLVRFVMGAVAAQVIRKAASDVISLPTAAGDAATGPPTPSRDRVPS